MIARFLRWLIFGVTTPSSTKDGVDLAAQRLIKAVEEMQAELKRDHK